MIPRYKKKGDEVVEAVQYDGDAMSMMWIVEMVPEDRLESTADTLKIKDALDDWEEVKDGEYVLKDSNGLWVISEEEFRNDWELI